MSPTSKNAAVTVLGAGAWGTTIAWLLGNNGHEVRLWARDAGLASTAQRERRNPHYLTDLELPSTVRVTSDLEDAVAPNGFVFAVVPVKAMAAVMGRLRQAGAAPRGIVSCSKGLRAAAGAGDRVSAGDGQDAGLTRPSELIGRQLPTSPVAALSGPNLASEIAAGQPAATTVASLDPGLARDLQRLLQQRTFRVYTSGDIVGVELAGALKNVIAIAAGICDGLALGDNAKSTIITRGLAELVRLGRRLGGQERTFYGLAGVGDIVATCVSDRSRNHTAGVLLAAGETLGGERLGALTAEGLPTVAAVHRYAVAHELDLPITAEVYRVAYERKPPERAMIDLMTREGKAE